jgi:hypothetical protein
MMTRKHFGISLIFFSFAWNACAKSENATTDTSVAVATDDKALFVTRKLIANDQKTDIDGDGKTDVVELVNISKNTKSLPPVITLSTPWALTDEPTEKSPQLKNGSHNNVLVTFGNSKQFLIHDVNAVSLLDTDAAQEISVASNSELEGLDLSELSAQAKGDVIVVPTEAGIDTYLYWNGATFQSYEPSELP